MKKVFLAVALLIMMMPTLAQTFKLVEGSEARFYIDEVLMGADKRVIGISKGVSGDIMLDLANPQTASLGIISIDATLFSTDDNRRNGKVHNDILKTRDEANKLITFEATKIEGLPESMAVGTAFELTITGNLTMVGVMKEAVFMVNVTPVSESELQGLGSATILYKDFNLSVPRVPIVARVADEILLELVFVAKLGE